MTPEGVVKESVKKMLKEYRAYYFLPVSGGYGTHGIPDFCCCINGYSLFIETKKKGGKVTPLQEIQKTKIEAAGGAWFLVDGQESLEVVRRWVHEASS